MKISIRQSVFETNSSSTHALAIKKTEYNSEDKRLDGKEIRVDNFGWEREDLKTPARKLSYIYTRAWELKDANDDKLYNSILDAFPNTKFIPPELITVYNDDLDPTSGIAYTYVSGGIEHGDLFELDELFRNNIFMLRAFVYNNENVILTGNDNSDHNIYEKAKEIAGPKGRVIYKSN
jgi:hypothetical protein